MLFLENFIPLTYVQVLCKLQVRYLRIKYTYVLLYSIIALLRGVIYLLWHLHLIHMGNHLLAMPVISCVTVYSSINYFSVTEEEQLETLGAAADRVKSQEGVESARWLS